MKLDEKTLAEWEEILKIYVGIIENRLSIDRTMSDFTSTTFEYYYGARDKAEKLEIDVKPYDNQIDKLMRQYL